MVLADEVFSSSGSPDDILWLLQDHQNSVTDVATIPASGQAQLVNHIEYNAFGAITSQANSSYQPLQTYTGQIQDDAVDLLYYDARWYDPQLAKFTSEDPIDFLAGDVNLIRYVGNSMMNRSDPGGLQDQPSSEGSIDTLRYRKEFYGQLLRHNGQQIQILEYELDEIQDQLSNLGRTRRSAGRERRPAERARKNATIDQQLERLLGLQAIAQRNLEIQRFEEYSNREFYLSYARQAFVADGGNLRVAARHGYSPAASSSQIENELVNEVLFTVGGIFEAPALARSICRLGPTFARNFADDATKLTAPKTSTVNRIEGGVSRERFIIDEAGNVTITRPRGRARRGVNISLSFDDTARQSSLAVRDSRTGAVIKTFEVRKDFADKVRRIAVPEQPGGRDKFSGLPFRVDKKYKDAFQIPPEMFDELESAIIPGTGRVIQPGS